METHKRGHGKNNPGEKCLQIFWKLPSRGSPLFPGDRASRPREGTFRRLMLAEFGGGTPSFAGDTY